MQFRPGPPVHPLPVFARPPFMSGSVAMPPGGVPPPHLMRPPMMIPAPAGPVVLTPPGSTPTPAPAQKSTTLYVGKIASTVSDETIQTLLEACGPVKSWKPMQDPETNKSKGFGFCEFETAEGVLRALRLLHNLSLDGQELLLKCNTATQRYIDEYQASKQREESKKEQAKQQADSDKDAEVKQEDSKADSQEEDDAVLVKIMALVSDRAAQQSSNHNAEQAAELLNEVLPPPPSHERSKSRTQASASKERTHSSRERERGSSADRNAERQFERERQRQRREVELRQADLERMYQKKLKDWEHSERLREKAVDKERADRKALEKERAKLIRTDNEVEDEDEDKEPWMRKSLYGSRSAESRRRKRKEEVREDAADRDAEEAERAAARQKREEQAQTMAEEEAEAEESDQELANGTVEEEEETVDPDDPIYQAMMAAAQAPLRSASPLQQPSPSPQPTADKHPPDGLPSRPTAAAPASKPGWHSVFGGDEDLDTPQRRLIPLKYSEEEQKAAQQAAAAAAANAAAAPAAVMNEDEELAKLKKQIPRSMQALTTASINWDAYDAGQPEVGHKVGKWVSGQIERLLGQQEDSLLNFVQAELRKHSAPAVMLSELSPILDLEAEEFVFRLYQIVFFEASKFALLGHV